MVEFDDSNGGVRFVLRVPVRGPVYLVGDFNGWLVGSAPMERRADGWMVRVSLPAGRYRYGFASHGMVLRDREAPAEDTAAGWPWSVVAVPDFSRRNRPSINRKAPQAAPPEQCNGSHHE